VSFTGSVVTGKKIMVAAAESNLKKVTLELGGKSPCVVFDDVDVDHAVRVCDAGLFMHQGQVCTAGSRVFVHEKIYDSFVNKMKALNANKEVGDPRNGNTKVGPVVDSIQMKRVLEFIESGKKENAKLECGGERYNRKGYYIQPTIFTNVTENMQIYTQEIFGPVMVILKFKDMKEVIEKANQTVYGLAAAVLTRDIRNALTVAKGIRAGTVWINCYGNMDQRVPFGGYKQSGIGRESGKYALKEYTDVKTVYVSML